MSTQKKFAFKKSNVLGKKPTSDQLIYGEMALNYNADSVDAYIKNSKDEVVSLINDSNFAKYFSSVKKSENVSHLYTNARFNVISLSTAGSYALSIDAGKIMGNEVNAIFVNNTTSNITITLPTSLNGLPVKSFDGYEILVPSNANEVNMVEVNIVFDDTTYYVRIA